VAGLQFGGQGATHRFSILGRLTLDILGVEYRNVSGFSGSSEVFNAVRRKEVDIQTAPLNFYRFTVEPSVVKSGEVVPLWYNPVINQNGEVVPLEAAGDMPNFFEYYETVKGEPPSGELYEMYRWLLPHLNGVTYVAFLPRGTSETALEILSDSFDAVTADPAYRAEEEKIFGFNLPVVSAEEGNAVIRSMANAPQGVREFLDRYIQEGL